MSFKLNAAVAALAFAAAPAFAALTSVAPPNCANTDVTPNSFACSGAWGGNDANQQADVLAELNNLLADTWSLSGKSDDANNGPFTGNPEAGSGTLTFDSAMSGNFAIALKSGNQFSLYVWQGAVGVTEVGFDTIGTSSGRDLSHATLYVGTIPEPETYALMLAGLGIVGFMARRRRA
jgi:hypothetical protein